MLVVGELKEGRTTHAIDTSLANPQGHKQL
jgi:hypothetical protein